MLWCSPDSMCPGRSPPLWANCVLGGLLYSLTYQVAQLHSRRLYACTSTTNCNAARGLSLHSAPAQVLHNALVLVDEADKAHKSG